MDAVSAVSLAASIVSFVDFSCNLVKGSYTIYQAESGTSPANAQTETVLTDLENVTKNLQANVDAKNVHHDFLMKLTSECTDVSTELSDILRDLKRKEGNKVWRSLEAKWNSIRKEKDVTSIEQRLNSIRLELLLRLNLIISEEQSSVKLKLAEIEQTGLRTFAGGADELKDVQQAIQQLKKVLVDEISETSRKTSSEQLSSLAELRAGFSTLLSKLDKLPKTTTVEESILRRLYFSSMHYREDSIHDAGFGTFDWLLEAHVDDDGVRRTNHGQETTTSKLPSSFQGEGKNQNGHTIKTQELSMTDSESKSGHNNESESERGSEPRESLESSPRRESKDEREEKLRQETRQSFLKWLQAENNIYHISGKPGSGKSTLMKFLCQHPRLIKELKDWAGNKKLVFANFFFWNSGNREQKTLEGLYRSLLFTILSQHPGLAEEAFPMYYSRAELALQSFEGLPFRFSELKQAVRIIMEKRSFPHHRFCFFIDGLDEFEVDLHTDHWELAQRLMIWGTSPDVKICVSSRPHEEFIQSFDPKLRMHLHDLTRGDVQRFVYGVLEKEQHYKEEEEDYQGVVNTVVRDAEGVFLWVRFVVRSLIDGIRHRYSPEALQKKVNSLPRGLEQMFDQLFDSIDSSDQERSDKMLLLAASDYPQTAIMYSWIDDLADPDFPYNRPICAYSDQEVLKRLETVRCQLDGLSKGLLEIRRSPVNRSYNDKHYPMAEDDIYFHHQVDFFHRTVKEYLNDPKRIATIKNRLGDDFHVVDEIQRLRLAKFKFARTMASYFIPQGLAQTELVGNFTDMFGVKGFKYTTKFLVECERVLDHHRWTPFTYPNEKEENPNIIAWSQGFDSSKGSGTVTGDDISYLHWLIHQLHDQDYLIDRVLANPTILTHNGFSILLTAAGSARVQLAQELLKVGVSPHSEVTVRFRDESAPENVMRMSTQTTTVWAAFLFYFAAQYIDRQYKEYFFEKLPDYCAILGEFFKFDASCDVSFLLEKGSEDIVLVSLEDLILDIQPPNLDVLMQHILKQRGSWLWQGTKHMVTMAVSSWAGDTQITPGKFRRAPISSLSLADYTVKTIFVGNERLERGFIARWW